MDLCPADLRDAELTKRTMGSLRASTGLGSAPHLVWGNEAWQTCRSNSIWSPVGFKQELVVAISDKGRADNIDVLTLAKGRADQYDWARPEAPGRVNSATDEEGVQFPDYSHTEINRVCKELAGRVKREGTGWGVGL